MQILFSPPDITEEEIEEVAAALRSGWITTGPRVKELEKRLAKYCQVQKAVCLNSATAALELTLRILGVGPGDEVITSVYTYTASASPVVHLGAKLVLIDTAKNSYEMDYEKLSEAINERTKVIIPVDLAGIICDYDRIFDIVNAKKELFHPANDLQEAIGRVIVVADCAHALGASRHGKMAGSIADFSSFSFHAVKNFTTAEGGCVTWKNIPGVDNEEIYHEYQLLSLHGQNKDALAKTKLGAWEYDIKGCYYKCNMTDIMAAIGLVQMRRYPKMLERRRDIIKQYNKEFGAITVSKLYHYGVNFSSSGHLYMLRMLRLDSKQRDCVISKLAELGIATNVHYKPLPLHTAYKKLGFKAEKYLNAMEMYQNEITLPLYSKLSNREVAYIIQKFKEVLKAYE